MLTAAELAEMRSLQNEAMASTCVVMRAALASDGMGGSTDTWVAAGTVSCRVMPASQRGQSTGREQVTADRITEIVTWVVPLPHDTDVVTKDRIVESGRTFEVVLVNAAKEVTALRVGCIEVK